MPASLHAPMTANAQRVQTRERSTDAREGQKRMPRDLATLGVRSNNEVVRSCNLDAPVEDGHGRCAHRDGRFTRGLSARATRTNQDQVPRRHGARLGDRGLGVTRREKPATSDLRDGPSRVHGLLRAYARADRTGTRARPTIFEKSRSALIVPVYPASLWRDGQKADTDIAEMICVSSSQGRASARVKT